MIAARISRLLGGSSHCAVLFPACSAPGKRPTSPNSQVSSNTRAASDDPAWDSSGGLYDAGEAVGGADRHSPQAVGLAPGDMVGAPTPPPEPGPRGADSRPPPSIGSTTKTCRRGNHLSSGN